MPYETGEEQHQEQHAADNGDQAEVQQHQADADSDLSGEVAALLCDGLAVSGGGGIDLAPVRLPPRGGLRIVVSGNGHG